VKAREAGYMAALNRLCKWRAIFAGWQLGTRAKGDPESDAVRDHREVTILIMLHGEQGGASVWLTDDGRYSLTAPGMAA
jgi:hypothetical protein